MRTKEEIMKNTIQTIANKIKKTTPGDITQAGILEVLIDIRDILSDEIKVNVTEGE